MRARAGTRSFRSPQPPVTPRPSSGNCSATPGMGVYWPHEAKEHAAHGKCSAIQSMTPRKFSIVRAISGAL